MCNFITLGNRYYWSVFESNPIQNVELAKELFHIKNSYKFRYVWAKENIEQAHMASDNEALLSDGFDIELNNLKNGTVKVITVQNFFFPSYVRKIIDTDNNLILAPIRFIRRRLNGLSRKLSSSKCLFQFIFLHFDRWIQCIQIRIVWVKYKKSHNHIWWACDHLGLKELVLTQVAQKA